MHDRQTGLHYNWFRYYDPKTGQYLQPDPIGLSGSINPYAYANGNPGIYIDPDGRFPILLAIWGGYEIFSSLADLWAFLQTLDDPCATLGDKVIMGMAVIGSVAGPGGGYGTAFRRGAKTVLSKNTFRKNLKLMTGRNPSPFVHAHHVFATKYEAQFAAIGVRNIHLPAYGAWWKATPHLSNSRAYNRAWEEFFDHQRQRTAQEAYDYARKLSKDFGFKTYFREQVPIMNLSDFFYMTCGCRRGEVVAEYVGHDFGDPFRVLRGEDPPPPDLVFRPFMGTQLKDYLSTSLRATYLVSDRIVDLLTTHRFTGWKTYPVTIELRKGGVLRGHSLLVVTGQCGPLDDSKSPKVERPSRAGDGVLIEVYMGLFFDLDTWDGSDLFVPQGSGFKFVAKAVRDCFRKARVTNVDFERLDQVERPMIFGDLH